MREEATWLQKSGQFDDFKVVICKQNGGFRQSMFWRVLKKEEHYVFQNTHKSPKLLPLINDWSVQMNISLRAPAQFTHSRAASQTMFQRQGQQTQLTQMSDTVRFSGSISGDLLEHANEVLTEFASTAAKAVQAGKLDTANETQMEAQFEALDKLLKDTCDGRSAEDFGFDAQQLAAAIAEAAQ